MIKELIVVEGMDDIAQIKNAVDADIVATHGYKIKKTLFDELKKAVKTRGVIVFTDPDYAGKMIRRTINENVKGCKNAYLRQSDAIKKDDIGVENASKEAIIDALMNARASTEERKVLYTTKDLYETGLLGASGSSERREKLASLLKISNSNAKKMLDALNYYQISREDFEEAMKKID